MTLLYLGSAWLVGIWLASLLSPPLESLLFLLALPFLVLLLGWRKPGLRLPSLSLLFLLCGALRYDLSLPRFDEGSLAYYNDRGMVTLQGVVIGEPEPKERTIRLRLEAERLYLGGQERQVRGLALVNAPLYPLYRYGDRLEVEGELETPPVFEAFSYKDYLARQGIHSLVRYPQITLLARDQGNPFYEALYAFKDRAQGTIRRLLPEPEAALLSGILLGRDSEIPTRLREEFNRTQTSHIIAISGFNVAIVAGLLSYLGDRLLGKRRSPYLALGGIALYTLLVGASPSVVRAAIVGGLYILALHLGRQRHALISLMVAAFLMTLLNPLTLWDLGFQLSFAATLGLILYLPSWQGWLMAHLEDKRWNPLLLTLVKTVCEAILVTLAAQLWVLPVILHNFRSLSPLSLLSNALIAPAQAGIMTLGGLATILGLLILPLGQIVAWVAWLPLAWTIWVVEKTAPLPLASLEIGGFSLGLAGLSYGLLLLAWAAKEPSFRERWRERLGGRHPHKVLLGGLAILALLVWLAAFSLPDGRLHLSFLDVGQGDSILIEGPSGHQILVDGGPSPAVVTAALGKKMAFWDRSLDLVAITHPQDDHLAGLVGVLERYRVGKIIYSGQGCATEACQALWEVIEDKGIPTIVGRAGIRLDLGNGVSIEVLHPPDALLSGTGSDINNNSLVLRVTMGRASFLLPGDLQEEGERALLASARPLGSTVLKVPHHGSATALSSPFLGRVGPQLAVISVGADNPFGHPTPQTLAELEAVTTLRTDERGTIEIVTDGQRFWVLTER